MDKPLVPAALLFMILLFLMLSKRQLREAGYLSDSDISYSENDEMESSPSVPLAARGIGIGAETDPFGTFLRPIAG